MLTRADLLNDPQLRIEKAQGSLMGLAVGDAMGDLGRSAEVWLRFTADLHLPTVAAQLADLIAAGSPVAVA